MPVFVRDSEISGYTPGQNIVSKRQSSPSYVTVKPKRVSEQCRRPRKTENAALSRLRGTGKLDAMHEHIRLLSIIAKNPAAYPKENIGIRPARALGEYVLERWIASRIGWPVDEVRHALKHIDEVLSNANP